MEIRSINYPERKYTYSQSMQLEGQTGCIGHLRGDFGSNGNGFFTTWFDHRQIWKTDEFKSVFDDMVNALRSDEYGLLKSRTEMVKFSKDFPGSIMKGSYTTEYGFRVDMDKYAFLLRCNPNRGDYNFYCYCYVAEYLDHHISEANKDIRFIDSSYKDLFRLPDGKSIVITDLNGEKKDYYCRYIDQTHLEAGDNLYHICEFAEIMERNGRTYAPKEMPLPPECFSTLPSTGEAVHIIRYEKGYTPIKVSLDSKEEHRSFADRKNEYLGVNKAQEAAMLGGSMFGWDTPAAQPKSYDENGKPMKPKNKDYER